MEIKQVSDAIGVSPRTLLDTAMSRGVSDHSYDTVRWGFVGSYRGNAVFTIAGSKGVFEVTAEGFGPRGTAQILNSVGGIRFELKRIQVTVEDVSTSVEHPAVPERVLPGVESIGAWVEVRGAVVAGQEVFYREWVMNGGDWLRLLGGYTQDCLAQILREYGAGGQFETRPSFAYSRERVDEMAARRVAEICANWVAAEKVAATIEEEQVYPCSMCGEPTDITVGSTLADWYLCHKCEGTPAAEAGDYTHASSS